MVSIVIRGIGRYRAAVIACIILIITSTTFAQTRPSLATATEQFRKGEYSEALSAARAAIINRDYSVDWYLLLANSLLELGQYEQAATEMTMGVVRYPTSISILKMAYETNLYAGHRGTAELMFGRINQNSTLASISEGDSTGLVLLGEVLLKSGYEPQSVLEQVYNRALQNDPNCRQAYMSIAELAIEKQDYDLAAQKIRQGLQRFGDEPDMHYYLAKALYYSDRVAMLNSIDAALVINPNHSKSLLLLAEHLIDCEDYAAAAEILDRIIKINPWQPQAWALRCVLAYIDNDTDLAEKSRSNALKYWSDNPNIDYLIGSKLSMKYLFAEGAKYQRQALAFDSSYIPAKIQLAEDLLRLGQEEQGWELAEEVYNEDRYNVQAYNLVSLHDHMATYKNLQEGRFTVRMEPTEAITYGQSVLEILQQAESVLCEKYGLTLEKPVIVEIFANQQDFAVRTFGVPGGDGFLGVCFGTVITANSPAVERPSNWQSMLWHEFCHVVTLTLTDNKMPRWLSEGLSVYEESQRDPICGRSMTPTYRSMILEQNSLVPISELSSAFLSPPTPMHLQFAYYESSLVVEYIIENFGYDSIKLILADLKRGYNINQALARRTTNIDKLEEGFAEFAVELAKNFAPDVDWEQPDNINSITGNPAALENWLAAHPNSLWALTAYAKILIEQEQWQQAEEKISKILEIYPQYTGQDNPYQLSAQIYQVQGQIEKEREILDKLAQISSDSLSAYSRLMEIASDQNDWPAVLDYGQKYFEVYPLPAALHRQLAVANEALGNDQQAINAYQCLLELDSSDPANVHYHLAVLLMNSDIQAAKKHILSALAEAPRFRQGHSLLLKILEAEGKVSGRLDSDIQNEILASQENVY